jgi:L-aminopeptidase/D-esterase-like protein
MLNDTLTVIDSIRVGHAVLPGIPSGCTVIVPRGGATAGVDVRGGAPATCGTDTLNPLNLVTRIHGLFFSGGSTFGLSVAEGLKRYLKEKGVGFDTGHGLVPIVSGAMIFDLGLNVTDRYPDADLGHEACRLASEAPVPEGCEGAGLGATVGKLHGLHRGMKGGLGSFCIEAPTGVQVGALMVVNAFGNVVDPESGLSLAGCRENAESLQILDAEREIRRLTRLRGFPEGQHTVVGAVATNVKLNKTQLTKVAQMAHDGLARTIHPAHTLYDGDTIFALSCGDGPSAEVSIIGALAAEASAEAVLRAVRKARAVSELPAYGDIWQGRSG